MNDTAGDEKKMPLLDHLVELRQRLLYSFVGFIVAFFVCYGVAEYIFQFLVRPLADGALRYPRSGAALLPLQVLRICVRVAEN